MELFANCTGLGSTAKIVIETRQRSAEEISAKGVF